MKSSFLLFILGLFLSTQAFALPKYMRAFSANYPQAKKTSCVLCHTSEGNKLNPYGLALQKSTQAGAIDFKSVEPLDSDEDSYTNLEEITAGSFPGDKDSTPSRP